MNKNTSNEWKNLDMKYNDFFLCPHCGEKYGHNKETWDFATFKGKSIKNKVSCRKCNKSFMAELCVVCVYSSELLEVEEEKTNPHLVVIQGGKKD